MYLNTLSYNLVTIIVPHIILNIKNLRKEQSYISNNMEKTAAEIINDTKHLLYNIHMGQKKKVYNQCTKNILWKYNYNSAEGILNDELMENINKLINPSEIQKIKHINHRINRQFVNQIIVTGMYCIHKSIDKIIKEYYFDYTINYVDNMSCYIHINLVGNNNIPARIYNVVSVKEHIHNIPETDILYIEAMGGHTIWHGISFTIEAVTPLKDIEDKMSEEFIKVHRSYIVNRRKVKEIRRCAAIMENGDEVPIPYKKYVMIRDKLMIN